MRAKRSEVPSEAWAAVRTLVRSACMFRDAFVRVAEGFPVPRILDTWGDTLALAEAVIDRWASQFRLDPEAFLDALHGEDNPGRGTKRSRHSRRGVSCPGRRPGLPV
jgi:hypothetical protein